MVSYCSLKRFSNAPSGLAVSKAYNYEKARSFSSIIPFMFMPAVTIYVNHKHIKCHSSETKIGCIRIEGKPAI